MLLAGAMHQKSSDSDSVNGDVMEPSPIPVQHIKSFIATAQDQIAAQYKVRCMLIESRYLHQPYLKYAACTNIEGI